MSPIRDITLHAIFTLHEFQGGKFMNVFVTIQFQSLSNTEEVTDSTKNSSSCIFSTLSALYKSKPRDTSSMRISWDLFFTLSVMTENIGTLFSLGYAWDILSLNHREERYDRSKMFRFSFWRPPLPLWMNCTAETDERYQQNRSVLTTLPYKICQGCL